MGDEDIRQQMEALGFNGDELEETDPNPGNNKKDTSLENIGSSATDQEMEDHLDMNLPKDVLEEWNSIRRQHDISDDEDSTVKVKRKPKISSTREEVHEGKSEKLILPQIESEAPPQVDTTVAERKQNKKNAVQDQVSAILTENGSNHGSATLTKDDSRHGNGKAISIEEPSLTPRRKSLLGEQLEGKKRIDIIDAELRIKIEAWKKIKGQEGDLNSKEAQQLKSEYKKLQEEKEELKRRMGIASFSNPKTKNKATKSVPPQT